MPKPQYSDKFFLALTIGSCVFAALFLYWLVDGSGLISDGRTITGAVGKMWIEGRANNLHYVSIDITDDENFVFRVIDLTTWGKIKEGQIITVTVRGPLVTVIDTEEEAQ